MLLSGITERLCGFVAKTPQKWGLGRSPKDFAHALHGALAVAELVEAELVEAELVEANTIEYLTAEDAGNAEGTQREHREERERRNILRLSLCVPLCPLRLTQSSHPQIPRRLLRAEPGEELLILGTIRQVLVVGAVEVVRATERALL